MFYKLPIVYGVSVLGFVIACVTLSPFELAIILTRKRELVALLLLSFGCLVTVSAMWLFPKLP